MDLELSKVKGRALIQRYSTSCLPHGYRPFYAERKKMSIGCEWEKTLWRVFLPVACNPVARWIVLIIVRYRPQRSGGKVIFSQESVILFTGGGKSTWAGTLPEQLHLPGPGTPPEQVHLPGPGTPSGPVTPPDQVHPPGTMYTSQTRYPPRAVHAGRYGQQAGDMHPIGMHSCFWIFPDEGF